MSPERWKKIKAILAKVEDASAAERPSLVAEACRGDDTLIGDVESFLDFDEECESFIEAPLWSLKPEEQSPWGEDSALGQRVGPYRIERVLGHGGMGTVFLGQREDDFKQKVALKLVSWGMDRKEILARFYNERQILANLQHRNIARLLDGGTAEKGLPYFAMEYVEGVPIDAYCEDQDLSVRQCLELFLKVCSAVHVAHQNLVVHRDLKPRNILVRVDGEPKLLDFGIAKLLQTESMPQSFATSPGQGPMTPDYASPEQILNEPITTACDIYALGILLYRLLSGRQPYTLQGKGYAEMVSVIAFREPPKPSNALMEDEVTTVERPAAKSGVESKRHLERRRRQIAGDLDAIVMKAMRKEPQHRYGSAIEFANDIKRHLNGHPVRARQGNWTYLTGKFIRRHRLGLLVMAMMMIFTITATFLWRQAVEGREQAESEKARAESEKARADEARIQAERQREKAEKIQGFLEDLFKSSNPNESKGEELTAREILDRGKVKIAESFENELEVQADLFGTLGRVYNELGLYDEARELREQTLEIRWELYPDGHADLAVALNNLAATLYTIGDYEGAESYWRSALEMRRKLGQKRFQLDMNIFNLASALKQQGKYDEAENFFREVLGIREEFYGQKSTKFASGLYGLGATSLARGNLEEAEPLLRDALDIRIKKLGEENTKVADVLNSLAQTLHEKGDFEQAKDFYERALAIRHQLLGESHLNVVMTQKALAAIALDQGNSKAAGASLEQTLEKLRRLRPENDWMVAEAETIWGSYLVSQMRYEEAESFLIGNCQVIRNARGERTIYSYSALKRVIALYETWGKEEKAEEYRVILEAAGGSRAGPTEK